MSEKKKKSGQRKKKALVIVESPAKARTINKYLGSDFVVRASMGHVRDLPTGKFGIDLENGFEPEYTTIRGKGKTIAELKRLAKGAEAVYLAPDPDREGEAIAWHLFEALEADESKVFRVVFNEITKKAILAAFEEPGRLDMNKVDAQTARRVLDRIVGYKLSPLLWKKIAKGLSAGRVQSVAVRLIVEREQEIRAFIQEEYWRVGAHFEMEGKEFNAELKHLGQKTISKNLTQAEAEGVVKAIGNDPLDLYELEKKKKTRRPTPPFTTSQIQQKASTLLRFSAKKTMMIAQQLYEGVELAGEGAVGLITYMRTDSVRVSNDALAQARDHIVDNFGEKYLPAKPNFFANRSKGAQEAHEAIRPTEVRRTPESLEQVLSNDQMKLYRLIWNKFVASQMMPAIASVTTARFQHGDARFTAQGETEEFDGHLRVFQMGRSDREAQALPQTLTQGQEYKPESVESSQHFTQPAPRYTEATLVKELEKKGIGRPSTYAAIISTIQDRGYTKLEKRHFLATELGEIVTQQLVTHFDGVINVDFTSQMESDLDKVESGDSDWREVVGNFYKRFAHDLEIATKEMRDFKKDPELTDQKCEKCEAPMAVVWNKRGKFHGCSNYPECKYTTPVDGPRPDSDDVETDYTCPKCEKPMVIRSGSRGRFLACTGFPKCKSTASVDEDGKKIEPKPTGIDCDKCGDPMVVKGSRRGPFLACSGYPKCRNAKPLPEELREPPKPSGEDCEQCGKPLVIKTSRWGKEFLACSGYPECKNTRAMGEQAQGEGEAEGAAEASGSVSASGPGDQAAD